MTASEASEAFEASAPSDEQPPNTPVAPIPAVKAAAVSRLSSLARAQIGVAAVASLAIVAALAVFVPGFGGREGAAEKAVVPTATSTAESERPSPTPQATRTATAEASRHDGEGAVADPRRRLPPAPMTPRVTPALTVPPVVLVALGVPAVLVASPVGSTVPTAGVIGPPAGAAPRPEKDPPPGRGLRAEDPRILSRSPRSLGRMTSTRWSQSLRCLRSSPPPSPRPLDPRGIFEGRRQGVRSSNRGRR